MLQREVFRPNGPVHQGRGSGETDAEGAGNLRALPDHEGLAHETLQRPRGHVDEDLLDLASSLSMFSVASRTQASSEGWLARHEDHGLITQSA